MMAPIRATIKSTPPHGFVKSACKMPEKRLAPTAPAKMIAPAYQTYHDSSAKTMATTIPTIQETVVERNPVPKISCITRAPTKNPVTAPNTGSRMNQNRKPKKQTARPIRARMIPTRNSMASLHPPTNVLDRVRPDRRRSRSRPWSDVARRHHSRSHYTYTFGEVNWGARSCGRLVPIEPWIDWRAATGNRLQCGRDRSPGRRPNQEVKSQESRSRVHSGHAQPSGQSPGDDHPQGDHEQHQTVLQQQCAGQRFTLGVHEGNESAADPRPKPRAEDAGELQRRRGVA